MSQKDVPKHQRGKKKGRAPAHQNTFAWKHNANSKTTNKILESPNVRVCRRCHEKIEWRKKYRKYKPRTQLGKCNHCSQRRVKAAYHTICEKCTLGNKALKIVKEHLVSERAQPSAPPADDNKEEIMQEEGEETIGEPVTEEEPTTTKTTIEPTLQNHNRACAMCVKDFALPDPDEEEEDDDLVTSGKRLTLRQRKTLERKKAQKDKKPSRRRNDNDNEDPAEEEEGSQAGSDDMDVDDDDDDPFLRAVGGSDKLLTGEAYQQSLLQKEMQ